MLCAVDAGDFQLVRFAHVDEQGAGFGSRGSGSEPLAGFGDGDFERGGCVGHEGCEGERVWGRRLSQRFNNCACALGLARIRCMMRCLGIDYGTRRIGLGYGDELGVATPLPALVQSDAAARWEALGQVVHARRITDFVLGYPYNMDGSAGFKAREVDAFAAELRVRFGLPVHLVDERLTSYEAEDAGTGRKAGGGAAKRGLRQQRDFREQGVIDSRAATLILQDFLNQRFAAPPPISSAAEWSEGGEGAADEWR